MFIPLEMMEMGDLPRGDHRRRSTEPGCQLSAFSFLDGSIQCLWLATCRQLEAPIGLPGRNALCDILATQWNSPSGLLHETRRGMETTGSSFCFSIDSPL